MRLFVSVDLASDLHEDVEALQEEFADASGLSFTDPTQTHVTLKFLGEVPERRVGAIEKELDAAVEEADVDPFEAEFGGLGVFPNLDYISVVWLGVRDGTEELTRLHEAIEARMVDAGFDPEDHEFTPHATLARMSHAGGKELVQELVRERDPTVGRMTVGEVQLMKSELTSEGPEYSTVHSMEL